MASEEQEVQKRIREWSEWRGEQVQSMKDMKEDITELKVGQATLVSDVGTIKTQLREQNLRLAFFGFMGGLVGSGITTVIVIVATKGL